MAEATQSLRILMVTPRYLPFMGGTEMHVYEVSRRLAARSIGVTILTTMTHGRWKGREALAPCVRGTHSKAKVQQEEEIDGVRIIRVPAFPPRYDYYFAPHIMGIIKHGAWDLVHCQGCHTFVPPLAMLAAKAAKLPYIVTFHTGGHSSRFRNSIRSLQWKVLRPLLADASTLIGVSHFEADYFRQLLHLPAEQLRVIPNGSMSLEVSKLEAGPARTTHRMALSVSAGTLIVSVGRLERYKGHQRLITALPQIRSWRPDARLLILGTGPYESALRALARKTGVGEYVEIRAIALHDRQAMAQLLSQASLVALLSEYEAHPLAVIEALSLQRPVLVADTSGFRELTERNLVRSIPLHSTPQQIAWAVQQQIEEQIASSTSASHAHNPQPVLVHSLPTWDQCTDQLEMVYQAIMRRETCVS